MRNIIVNVSFCSQHHKQPSAWGLGIYNNCNNRLNGIIVHNIMLSIYPNVHLSHLSLITFFSL